MRKFEWLQALILILFLPQACINVGDTPASANTGSVNAPTDTTIPSLTAVVIVSTNLNPALAKAGDSITLTITSSEPIVAPSVTIAGVPVAISTFSATSYSATLSVTSATTNGNAAILVSGIVDLAGNAAADVTATTDSSTVTIDTVAPLASSTPQLNPLDDSGLSSSDAITSQTTALTFSGTTEAGATVQLYDTSVTAGLPVSAVSGSWSIDLSLAAGTHNIMARVTDAAGNTSPGSIILPVTVDTAAPILTFVTIASNNTNTTLAKTGNTITVSITASQSITTPTVTIATRAATVTGSGANYTASLLTDGTETNGIVAFNISGYSDLAGNGGATVSAITAGSNVTFDNIAPSGYSVTIDQTAINNANQTALSFTMSLAEIGTTYNYSISSSGGGTPVSGTGLITATTQQKTGVNVSGLGDGTLTLSVTLTDSTGNVGTPATATKLKDVVAPTILSAETMDANSNGKIDHYKITFSKAVTDATFPGYLLNSNGNTQVQWVFAGYSNAVLAHGTSAPVTDTVNDAVIYIKFTEGATFDTGAKPDLTTTAAPGITDLAGNPVAQVGTLNLVEQDSAKPIVASVVGSGQTGVNVVFSESVKALTAEVFTNYTISAPLTLSAAVMSGGAGVDGNKVVLTTSAQTFNTIYTVTTHANITDLATVANGVNAAANSGTFSGATPAATAVAGSGQRQNTITWGAVAGATSYNIYWSTTPGVTTASVNKAVGAVSPYLHSNLTPAITLYYIVTAVVGVESTPAAEVNATPFLQPLKTGQTQCWDSNGTEIIGCIGIGADGTTSSQGQDGQLQRGRVANFTGPVASTYKSDGIDFDYTITDNDIGLVWKACSEGLSDPNCATGMATPMDWATATGVGTGCDVLNITNAGMGYAGLKTWRVPTIEELQSIINYSGISPSTFQLYFPETVSGVFNHWWSASTTVFDTTAAYSASFADGFIGAGFKSTANFIRCVSGNSNIMSVLYDNGNGTVFDKARNLIWQSSSSNATSWINALNYCNNLTLSNRNWRLPNYNELMSIVDRSKSMPTIDVSIFPETVAINYWTSNTLDTLRTAARTVSFEQGTSSVDLKSYWGFNVRCVADGP